MLPGPVGCRPARCKAPVGANLGTRTWTLTDVVSAARILQHRDLLGEELHDERALGDVPAP